MQTGAFSTMELPNNLIRRMQVFLVLSILSLNSVGAQFYSDYGGDGESGYPYNSLHPFEIPVIYKQQSYPAAYPVAPVIYQVALMKPIEPMPGKKTVPLYIVPEDSLLVNSNEIDIHSRSKRSHESHGHPLARVNIKYPEFYGLTDGYHIPAVEIPLHKPMIVRQIEVNVLAPEGFMVPFQSEDRQWPYPMTTGCLVASIPRNTYVADDHPITIRRLFAVPSLPEYPTYRPAFPNHQQQLSYGTVPHGHGQVQHSPHTHAHGEGLTVNLYQQGQQGQARPAPLIYAHPEPPKSKAPVFELVPVTPKSSRRNGKRRNGKDKDESDEDSRDRSEENESDSSKDSSEDSEEKEKESRRCRDRDNEGRSRSRNSRRNCRRDSNSSDRNKNRDRDNDRNRDRDNDRNRDRDNDRNRDRDNNRNRDRDNDRNRNKDRDNDRDNDREKDRDDDKSTTTRRTTTTRTTTTPTTTTTPAPTTPAASSIQDIIAAFSSFRDRERERDDRKNRISASFYQDEERDRTNQQSDRSRERDREGLRSGNPSDRDDEGSLVRDAPSPPPTPRPTPPPRDNLTPSKNNLQELREQVLQRQIDQLQRLLSSLNLTQENNNSSSKDNNSTS